MKIRVLLLSILCFGSAFAQVAPSVSATPSPLLTVPAGVNSAAYPMQRVQGSPEKIKDWLRRVEKNIQVGEKMASSIELIFEGDSITNYWPRTGKEVWEKHYAKLHPFDFGISGDRTEHVLWRLSQGQAKGMHPKLIAIMIGTNNVTNTPEQIAEGVKAIVAEYQKRCPEAAILLQGVFPRGEKPGTPARAKIKQINQIISKLGDGRKVIYVDFGDKFLQPDGTISAEVMPDFLHPSAKGYQIWADAIQPIIDQFFPMAAKP
ncbi:MAG: GDSL-type esterase/lipase family protein [Verrucomicrobia bacterium]|nr:GDSL-type esterase/lipase family protein [Verrucomicrobiota bacterium]